MIYDKEYYKGYVKYSGTQEEKELMDFRVDILRKAISYTSGFIRVVDLGCAAGAFMKAAKNIGIDDIVGIDVIQYAISHCVKEGLKVFTPEMFDYFYEDNEKTVMTFWDSLEHLRDPKALLNKHKPKVICVSMPCLDGFKEAFGEDTNIQLWKHWKPLEHLWNFDKATLVSFLEKAGYEIVYFTHEESQHRKDSNLGDKNIMTIIAKRISND